MTSVPQAAGAPAVILYRSIKRNDNAFEEHDVVAIKILDHAGLGQANAVIVFNANQQTVSGIEGRTIEPNGTVVDFHGKIREQPVADTRGVKLLEKVFTLPDARVGSIVEYRFEVHLPFGQLDDSRWILSKPLFTEDARFSLVPARTLALRALEPQGLPPGTRPPEERDGVIRMQARNIPAFASEPDMPPPDTLRFVVDFVYLAHAYAEGNRNPAEFWNRFARFVNYRVNRFISGHRAFHRDVAQIISPNNAPEVRLENIYRRVQQFHNLSFAPRGINGRAHNEKRSAIQNAQDVWTRGYGVRQQITWLFLALARAAGFKANPVVVSTRNVFFFRRALMDPGELNATLVEVTLGGKALYFAPGVPFTPFGMLPWQETGVRALQLNSHGGRWIATPMPTANASQVERRATLKLLPDGTLQGTVVVTYTGMEALWRRLRERNDDNGARKRFLQKELKSAVPSASRVTLTNQPDWNDAEGPLVADFQLRIPGWATRAGSLALLTSAVFDNSARHTFVQSNRRYPVYVHFPFVHTDHVTIQLPPGWRVKSVPPAREDDFGTIDYRIAEHASAHALHLSRRLKSDLMLVGTAQYPKLRQFYGAVRAGDNREVVLVPHVPAAS